MCCRNSPSLVHNFLTKYKGRKTAIVYKVLTAWDKKMYSPHRQKYYKIGWNNSDSRRKKVSERYNDTVSNGIHVYLDTESAKQGEWMTPHSRIVPVKIYIDELLAIGYYGHAVFKRVYITKKTWDRALITQRGLIENDGN